MRWLGLTGGIASGKSTVSSLLREAGIPVLDADQLAHEVVAKGSPGLKSVVEVFGEGILLEDQSLDRRKLGQLVFSQPERLRKLEEITHPLIQKETQNWRQDLEKQNVELAIYDIPLLFETKSQDNFDTVIVVTCTLEQQKARLLARNQLTPTEIEARLRAQIPLPYKEEQADFILRNNSDRDSLLVEFQRLMLWLKKK